MDYGMTSLFKQMRKWIGIPMCMYLLEHWNIGKWYYGICEVLFNVLYYGYHIITMSHTITFFKFKLWSPFVWIMTHNHILIDEHTEVSLLPSCSAQYILSRALNNLVCCPIYQLNVVLCIHTRHWKKE